MDEDTQKELVRLVKQALVVLSTGRRDENLLFELRDIVRKVEGKGGEDV
jgi:hypothetical protein